MVYRLVSGHAGGTMKDIAAEKSVDFSRGEGYYQLVKKEKVSAKKKMVLFKDGKYLTDEDAVIRNLCSLKGGDVDIAPGSIPSGHQLFVQSTSANRKISVDTAVLFVVDCDDGAVEQLVTKEPPPAPIPSAPISATTAAPTPAPPAEARSFHYQLVAEHADGVTMKEIAEEHDVDFSRGEGYYQLVKKEKVSAKKKMVLFKDGKYLTDDDTTIRKLCRLKGGDVDIAPASVPDGHQLFVQSTSANRKISEEAAVLFVVDGEAADSESEEGDDEEDEESSKEEGQGDEGVELDLKPVAGVPRVVSTFGEYVNKYHYEHVKEHADGATMNEIAAANKIDNCEGYYQLMQQERIPVSTKLLIFKNHILFLNDPDTNETAREQLGQVDEDYDLSPSDAPLNHSMFVCCTSNERTFTATTPVVFRELSLDPYDYHVRQGQPDATTYTLLRKHIRCEAGSSIARVLSVPFCAGHAYFKVVQEERIWAGQKMILFEAGNFLTDSNKTIRHLLGLKPSGDVLLAPDSLDSKYELFVQSVWQTDSVGCRVPALYKTPNTYNEAEYEYEEQDSEDSEDDSGDDEDSEDDYDDTEDFRYHQFLRQPHFFRSAINVGGAQATVLRVTQESCDDYPEEPVYHCIYNKDTQTTTISIRAYEHDQDGPSCVGYGIPPNFSTLIIENCVDGMDQIVGCVVQCTAITKLEFVNCGDVDENSEMLKLEELINSGRQLAVIVDRKCVLGGQTAEQNAESSNKKQRTA